MKRKGKKKRYPITEEAIEKAIKETFEKDPIFSGEIYPGVYKVSIPGSTGGRSMIIHMNEHGWKLYNDLLTEELKKSIDGTNRNGSL